MNDPSDRVPLGERDCDFVRAVVRRIVRDAHDADDVAQDALLLAVRHRARFRGESHYRTWLYRIAWTSAIAHRRRLARQAAHPTEALSGAETLGAAAPGPDELIAQRQRAIAIHGALAGLAPGYRSVLQARLDGCQEEEISRRLGLSRAAVKVRAHRARHQLRAALEVHAPGR